MWLGLLGLTYVAGIATGGLAWGSFIGLTVLSGVFLPYFVRKRISSPAEFLQLRYSPATRGLFALLSILYLVLGVLVPALYVGGWVLSEAGFNLPLSTASGIPWVFFACVAGIALFSSLAGVIGGSLAGAWGGAVQFLVIAIGGTVFAVVATQNAGGLASVWENNGPAQTSLLLSSRHELLPWVGMVAFALTIGFWNSAVSPLAVQRCLGARSEWDARLGAIVGGLLLLVLPAVFILPGLAAAVKLGPLGKRSLAGSERPAVDRNPFWAAESAGRSRAGARGRGDSRGRHEQRRRRGPCRLDPLDHGHLPGPVAAQRLGIGVDRAGAAVEPDDDHRRDLARAACSWPGIRAFSTTCWKWRDHRPAGRGGVSRCVFLAHAHGRSAVATLISGCLVGAALWFIVAHAEVVPEWLKPVVTRAGVTGLASLVLLGLFTFVIPQSSGELYDPDAAWSLDLATLPPHERDAGSGLGNLLFWWGLLCRGLDRRVDRVAINRQGAVS